MPIVSQKVVSYKVGSTYNAKITYLLADGREIKRPPIFCKSQAHAEQLALEHQDQFNLNRAKRDSKEAVERNILVAYKDATLRQVQFAWMRTGLSTTDPYEAFMHLRHHVEAMISQGLSNAELAIIFSTTPEIIKDIKNRWLKLKNHEAVLASYKAIKEDLR